MRDKIKTAFTLIELLVVIAIIGILSGLIIVGMGSVTQSATIAKSQIFSSSLRDSLLLNLISEWKLDGNANDLWGNKNGAWSGSAGGSNTSANYRPANECVYDQCINLDGTDDYISIASLPNQSIHGPSTVELWFKPLANSGRIFADHCMEWGIRLSSGNIEGVAYSSINGGAVSLNNWHHVAMIHDHPTGLTNTKLYLYVDGVKKAEGTLTITGNGYYDAPFYLGNDVCSAGTFFTGNIDNVRYYNSAISSSLIKQEYYAGIYSLLSKKEINKDEYQKLISEIGSMVAEK